MRFRLDDRDRRLFSAESMGYRGEGGWIWLKGRLTPAAACDHYVPLLGTDRLFEEF